VDLYEHEPMVSLHGRQCKLLTATDSAKLAQLYEVTPPQIVLARS
jgi:hypothetical protein